MPAHEHARLAKLSVGDTALILLWPGFTHRDYEPSEKRLFSYPDIRREPIESRHAALTAYLFDARGVTNRY